jgi:hypothetical protein
VPTTVSAPGQAANPAPETAPTATAIPAPFGVSPTPSVPSGALTVPPSAPTIRDLVPTLTATPAPTGLGGIVAEITFGHVVFAGIGLGLASWLALGWFKVV